MWPLSINAENKALKNICSPTNYISVFYSKATWIRQLAEGFSPSLADLISKQTLIGRGGKKTPPCKLWWADYGLDPAVIRHPLPLSTDVSKYQKLILQHIQWEPEHACASPGNNRAPCPPAAPQERETHSAQSSRSAFQGLTLTVEARSQLPAAGAWPPAVRHRCPPRNCAGAPREPPPPESTPSGEAARWMACGGTQKSAPRHTSIIITGREKQRAGGCGCVRVHICVRT